jgi:hypothetical protein
VILAVGPKTTHYVMDYGILLGDGANNYYDPNGYSVYNCVACNNVVISETQGNMLAGLALDQASNCAFFDNVTVGPEWGFFLRKYSSKTTINSAFKNNIIYNTRSCATVFSDPQAILDHDYNLYFDTHSSPPVEAHGVYQDPMFVNPLKDWHLQAGSPAIGKGTPVTFVGFYGSPINVSLDFSGIQRTDPWSLGIFAK